MCIRDRYKSGFPIVEKHVESEKNIEEFQARHRHRCGRLCERTHVEGGAEAWHTHSFAGAELIRLSLIHI